MDALHRKIARTAVLLCIMLFAVSCGQRNTRFVADTSDVDVNVKIRRFDKDLKTCSLDSLYALYGDFVDLYSYRILNLRTPEDLQLFVSDSIVNIIYTAADSAYRNVNDIENELTTAFRYFSFYFPSHNVPECMFHVSGFNQSVVVYDRGVSASIDLYLGSNYKYYVDIAHNYELPLMTRSRVAYDMAYAWVMSEFPMEGSDRLLDHMLYRGKLLYMMMVMFPNRKEADILGYNKEQYAWAKLFEDKVWGAMMEKKQLFSSDWLLISQLINPAPFTQGFTQDSPGRLGEYIGLQIIKAYMENNKDLTLYDMFAQNQAEDILAKSKYRP